MFRIRHGKKLKNMITADTRISLYQTAMNNAGRNFNGKKAPVDKVAAFATALYKFSIKEIENIGELNIQQIEKTLGKAPVKKVINKADFSDLMKRAKKVGGRK